MHLIAPIMHLIALGITAVPREIENKACAKFGGCGGGGGGGGGVRRQIRCIMGVVQVAYF